MFICRFQFLQQFQVCHHICCHNRAINQKLFLLSLSTTCLPHENMAYWKIKNLSRSAHYCVIILIIDLEEYHQVLNTDYSPVNQLSTGSSPWVSCPFHSSFPEWKERCWTEQVPIFLHKFTTPRMSNIFLELNK